MGARDAMVEAAFALFAERGYDATTVDDVVERAGVSRSSFFRAFGSKEEVIFPRHDDLRSRQDVVLAAAGEGWPDAVRAAVSLVLEQYLAEGALARARYLLTRRVPALRDREIASLVGYQRLFREHLRRWVSGADAELRAELLAAAIVTAHNAVLRRWLREEADAEQARAELATALDLVLAAPAASGGPRRGEDGDDEGTEVVVLRSGQRWEDVVPALRRALDDAD